MHRLIGLILCLFSASYTSNNWLYTVDRNVDATPLNLSESIYVSNIGLYDSQTASTVNQNLWAHIQNIGSFEKNRTEALDSKDFVEVKVISIDSLQFCLFQLNKPFDTLVYTGNFKRDVFQTDRIRELIPFYPIFFRKRIKTGTFYMDHESKFRLNSKSWSDGLVLLIFGGDGGGSMKTNYQIITNPID